jgi:hypothetical protein
VNSSGHVSSFCGLFVGRLSVPGLSGKHGPRAALCEISIIMSQTLGMNRGGGQSTRASNGSGPCPIIRQVKHRQVSPATLVSQFGHSITDHSTSDSFEAGLAGAFPPSPFLPIGKKR